MRRWLQYGGFAAGVVLILFGVVAIAMGANGRSTVRDSLRQEQIVGSPDMTPAAIKAEAKAAGLKNVALPTCSVAGMNDRDWRGGALLRQLHAHPRARGQRRPDLQPDGALRLGRRQGHQRRRQGAQRARAVSRSTTRRATSGSARPRSARR